MLSSGVEDHKFIMKVFVVLYISVCSCYSFGNVVFLDNGYQFSKPYTLSEISQPPQYDSRFSATLENRDNGAGPEQVGQCEFTEQATRKFPWTALIQYEKENNKTGYHCSGTLIGSRSVLTAAHCLTGQTFPKSWKAIAVRLGEWSNLAKYDCRDSRDCSSTYVDIPIESSVVAIPHRPEAVDIAILRLEYEVRFRATIKPACLPEIAKEPKSLFGRHAYISARRRLSTEIDEPSPVESIDFTSWDVCTSKYEGQNVTLKQEVHICALSESGIDTCLGDSGGGLFLQEGSEYILIGVLSFGPSPCGVTGIPAVYTRIDCHMSFIRRYMV